MVSLLSLFTLSLLGLALAAEPRQAVWSKQAFGPDGPWNAVEVSIGSQPNIALFPGRMFETYVTTSDYCAFNNSVPHCASGTYLKDRLVAGTNSATRRIPYQPETQKMLAGIETRGITNMYLETVAMQFGDRIVQVKNHTIALIESKSQMFAYPDGTFYPIFTGCLSIGAPDRQQVFTGEGAMPTINASMIPWALESAGETPSSSFGLHYGSAGVTAKIAGSLLFGGYDRNRVISPILSLDADFRNPATLQDISLHVIKGASPFPPSTTTTAAPSAITGLLAPGNDADTTQRTLPVILDPCSPYLTLPKATCDAIAAHLPVHYNASLGLYLWDTTSPRYRLITASASTLAFTFMGGSNTESSTIHVPFPHLNLTLAPPFTPAPVPYFPCYTGGAPGGGYALGRAFFQDAFLGANWEQGRAWLAQAPGPNVPAGVDVVAVAPGDGEIAGGGMTG
ncbi:aspartic peptidase domain-containing protein [Chaetomium sp. MPI-CAGE-AT-0009]|nr:aspartic peptidase domain-containing protein [Chaetomium sp. MPI-CAGE-AT-0009]